MENPFRPPILTPDKTDPAEDKKLVTKFLGEDMARLLDDNRAYTPEPQGITEEERKQALEEAKEEALRAREEFKSSKEWFAENKKKVNSPFELRTHLEGGVFNVDMEPLTKKEVESKYLEGLNNPYLSDVDSYVPPKKRQQAFFFLEVPDETIRVSSDSIVEELEKMGLRPPTYAEFIQMLTKRPDFHDRLLAGIICLDKQFSARGDAHALIAYCSFRRWLDTAEWSKEWYPTNSFVAVRK